MSLCEYHGLWKLLYDWQPMIGGLALVVVTIFLWRATKSDFQRRKIQDTVSAWGEVRKAISVGGLRQLDEFSKLNPAERMALREMEHFSSCINADIYDIDIFLQLSKSWFLQQYDQIKPYIGNRPNPAAYSDLKKLHQRVTSIRAEKGGFLRRLFP